MSAELQAQITAVQAQYAEILLDKAHVVGVGVGLAKVAGEYTSEMALVVMVDQKIPLDDLAEEDRIPPTLDGVRVDVQEVGKIEAF